MKHKKLIIIVLVVVISSLAGAVMAIFPRTEEIQAERDRVSKEKDEFIVKRGECTEKFVSTNPYWNRANLSECGRILAVDTLYIKTLSDIYRHYCYSGFGVAVYGCADARTNTVYVCLPGSTVYDRRYIGETYWYIYYQNFSYSCDDEDFGVLVRHELLHLVFESLPQDKKDSLINKLEKYRSDYSSELSFYPSSERDGELFVRVGADLRKLNDIELIDIYSKVTAGYADQKKQYYGSLVDMTDKYLTRYSDLLEKYNILMIVIISIAVINFFFLIFVIVVIRKTKKGAYIESGKAKKESEDKEILQRPDGLSYELDKKERKHTSKTRKEFEAFKKENGLIDR